MRRCSEREPIRGIFLDPISGGVPTDRIVRGGPGTLDFLSFQSTPAEPATVYLAETTIGAPWSAMYTGFEYAEGGTGNDRFRDLEARNLPHDRRSRR